MNIIKLTNQNQSQVIEQAVAVLAQGDIVIYPTETCYGVGVDATNQEAVDRVLAYKAKREGKPLSIAVTDKKMAAEYVEINEQAENLYDSFLPGPVTVISKSLGNVAKGIESEDNTQGIRIPDHQLILAIVEKLDKPVTSTSANASYKKTPYSVSDILDNLTQKQKDLVGLIIDAGQLPRRPASTVVDTTLNELTTLRQGSISFGNKEKYESQSPEETSKIGEELMLKYLKYLGFKSVIFAMKGELGAGKTQMAKGIAKALEVEDEVTSPTFIIENTYGLKIEKLGNSKLEINKNLEFNLIHIDTWRLQDRSELEELDFYKQVDEGNVFVIEWADKIMETINRVKADAVVIWVEIDYGEGEMDRSIKILKNSS